MVVEDRLLCCGRHKYTPLNFDTARHQLPRFRLPLFVGSDLTVAHSTDILTTSPSEGQSVKPSVRLYSQIQNRPDVCHIGMSQPPNVGTTLTGGIQDIAALLPLLGTEQCERHVGSALEGGYLYAAATPLSIFGSLGIVKLGTSVLISSISISIPRPSFSFRFTPYPKLSVTFCGRRWLAARTLDNAGFKPIGTVAPLIAMDGTRFTAETRLLEILKEKHIEDPEHLSVEWKSTEWNVTLVVCTIVAAVFSVIPYVAVILPGFRHSVVHSPWIFPLLRTVGSSLAVVCCQFLIQSRIISLMKNRIIFMIMDRMLVDDIKLKNEERNGPDSKDLDTHEQKNDLDLDVHGQNVFQWDENRPSEECLWDLEQYLYSQSSPNDGPDEGNLPASPSIKRFATEKCRDRRDVSIQMDTFEFSNPEAIRDKLRDLRNEHTRFSSLNRAFYFIAWTVLSLSLPATVAGYIGCFTLVSGSRGKGPLIWLFLEGALSIIRILLWAWNPSFDERTDITVKLKLTNHEPLVTTEKDFKKTGENTLALVPERLFLEWITSYTGPLLQFQTSENLALYFTLTRDQAKQKHLYMTVFDLNKRNAVTLHWEPKGFQYIDTVVTYNNITSEMQATLRSVIGKDHPWRTNHAILFDALPDYYISILDALNRPRFQSTTPDSTRSNTLNQPQAVETALLPRKWNLLLKPDESKDQSPPTIRKPLSLTEHDELYLSRGDEHDQKTKLIENWSTWIVENMAHIREDAQNDCHHTLADRNSHEAKWELTELDMQVAVEWTRREWSIVASSFELEGILHRRNLQECFEKVVRERPNERLKGWMQSEFAIGRRKRLEKEREQAKERMEKEMMASAGRGEAEGRAWRDQEDFSPKGMWEAGRGFIDEQWKAAIANKALAKVSHLDRLIEEKTPAPWDDTVRTDFVEQVRDRFKYWQHQRRNERDEMDATIKRIRDKDLKAYQYQKSDARFTLRFVPHGRYSQAKFFSATVYDVKACDEDIIRGLIRKGTTRSVIKVPQDLVKSIEENDHLLYLNSSGGGQEPSFVKKNRDKWWNSKERTTNSSMFYFSPQEVDTKFVYSRSETIAHIFVFLETRTRIRLRLLHLRYLRASVSIQKNNQVLLSISTNVIPDQLRLQDFELDWFEPGKHELQLVVTQESKDDYYGLRDILVEFIENPAVLSS